MFTVVKSYGVRELEEDLNRLDKKGYTLVTVTQDGEKTGFIVEGHYTSIWRKI